MKKRLLLLLLLFLAVLSGCGEQASLLDDESSGRVAAVDTPAVA